MFNQKTYNQIVADLPALINDGRVYGVTVAPVGSRHNCQVSAPRDLTVDGGKVSPGAPIELGEYDVESRGDAGCLAQLFQVNIDKNWLRSSDDGYDLSHATASNGRIALFFVARQ